MAEKKPPSMNEIAARMGSLASRVLSDQLDRAAVSDDPDEVRKAILLAREANELLSLNLQATIKVKPSRDSQATDRVELEHVEHVPVGMLPVKVFARRVEKLKEILAQNPNGTTRTHLNDQIFHRMTNDQKDAFIEAVVDMGIMRIEATGYHGGDVYYAGDAPTDKHPGHPGRGDVRTERLEEWANKAKALLAEDSMSRSEIQKRVFGGGGSVAEIEALADFMIKQGLLSLRPGSHRKMTWHKPTEIWPEDRIKHYAKVQTEVAKKTWAEITCVCGKKLKGPSAFIHVRNCQEARAKNFTIHTILTPEASLTTEERRLRDNERTRLRRRGGGGEKASSPTTFEARAERVFRAIAAAPKGLPATEIYNKVLSGHSNREELDAIAEHLKDKVEVQRVGNTSYWKALGSFAATEPDESGDLFPDDAATHVEETVEVKAKDKPRKGRPRGSRPRRAEVATTSKAVDELVLKLLKEGERQGVFVHSSEIAAAVRPINPDTAGSQDSHVAYNVIKRLMGQGYKIESGKDAWARTGKKARETTGYHSGYRFVPGKDQPS